MSFGQKVKALRNDRQLTQKEIAQILNLSPSTIGMYERDEREPSFEVLKLYADTFDVSLDYLMDRSNISKTSPKTTRRINIFGSVPAGIPIEAIQDIEDWEDIDLSQAPFSAYKDYIGLRVKGDSMYPKYLEGDYIIVEINPQPESGKDCVVYVNGYDATLKTVVKNNYVDDRGNIKTSYTLIPINPKYEPKTYSENDEPIVILGQVVQVRRNI